MLASRSMQSVRRTMSELREQVRHSLYELQAASLTGLLGSSTSSFLCLRALAQM